MDERSIEILQQLQAEVWWPWDRRGDRDGGYNLAPQGPKRAGLSDAEYREELGKWRVAMTAYNASPNINRNRWHALIGELIAMEPQNPDVRQLRRLYQHNDTSDERQSRLNRKMLLEAMLR